MLEKERFLDVSGLEPPEPLVKALSEAELLEYGQYLRMRHRREPCLLYPNLKKRGFVYLTCTSSDGVFELYIWRKGDTAAEGAAHSAANSFLERL